jgi:hypothetical protein
MKNHCIIRLYISDTSLNQFEDLMYISDTSLSQFEDFTYFDDDDLVVIERKQTDQEIFSTIFLVFTALTQTRNESLDRNMFMI